MATDGLDFDASLPKQPGRPRPFAMPDVLSDRIDKLVAAVNKGGTLTGTVHRKDLVAALVAFADEEVPALQTLLENYAELKVRDALVGDEKDAKVIVLRDVKPGRRTN
jgi:hypothetical protein